MNRPIKFRIWDIREKKMEDWDSVCAAPAISLLGLGNRDIHLPLQFTGLLDKNGVEIYEGDVIVYAEKNLPVVIRFEDGGYCVDMRGPNHSGFELLCTMYPGDIEVIGNLYENSNLLV